MELEAMYMNVLNRIYPIGSNLWLEVNIIFLGKCHPPLPPWFLMVRPLLFVCISLLVCSRESKVCVDWDQRAVFFCQNHPKFAPLNSNENYISLPTLTFHQIFILELAGKYCNKRLKIIDATYSNGKFWGHMSFWSIALECFKSSWSHLSSGGVLPYGRIL